MAFRRATDMFKKWKPKEKQTRASCIQQWCSEVSRSEPHLPHHLAPLGHGGKLGTCRVECLIVICFWEAFAICAIHWSFCCPKSSGKLDTVKFFEKLTAQTFCGRYLFLLRNRRAKRQESWLEDTKQKELQKKTFVNMAQRATFKPRTLHANNMAQGATRRGWITWPKEPHTNSRTWVQPAERDFQTTWHVSKTTVLKKWALQYFPRTAVQAMFQVEMQHWMQHHHL